MHARVMIVLALGLALSGCQSDSKSKAARGSGDAKRGQQLYLASCIACHHRDPSKDGSQGPAILGSSAELIRARILRAEYPPGYTPKRRTNIMKPLPSLEADIPDLAAYLSALPDSAR